jgi:hypothetical protein
MSKTNAGCAHWNIPFTVSNHRTTPALVPYRHLADPIGSGARTCMSWFCSQYFRQAVDLVPSARTAIQTSPPSFT